MLKEIAEIISVASNVNPVTLAIVFIGLISLAVIALAAIAINSRSSGRRK